MSQVLQLCQLVWLIRLEKGPVHFACTRGFFSNMNSSECSKLNLVSDLLVLYLSQSHQSDAGMVSVSLYLLYLWKYGLLLLHVLFAEYY
jgi:hypothetical protein